MITTDLRLNEPRFIKLPDIMKAKSKPMETLALADLGVESGDHLSATPLRTARQAQQGRDGQGRGRTGAALKAKGPERNSEDKNHEQSPDHRRTPERQTQFRHRALRHLRQRRQRRSIDVLVLSRCAASGRRASRADRRRRQGADRRQSGQRACAGPGAGPADRRDRRGLHPCVRRHRPPSART